MLFEGLGSNSPLSVALLSVCFSNVLATEKAYCTIFSVCVWGGEITSTQRYNILLQIFPLLLWRIPFCVQLMNSTLS